MVDGEDPGADPGVVEAHLAGCAACCDWREAAHDVTRRARLQLAEPVPSPAAEVLATLHARTRAARRPRRVAVARMALVAAAAAQICLAVPFLLFGHDRTAPQHVAHEMGSFDAALAVGFLVAAWRPARALGMRALLGVAAVLLVVTAVADLVAGRTTLLDEAPHLVAVAGWLLVRYLAAACPPFVPEPRPALAGMLRTRIRPLRTHRSPDAGTIGSAGVPAGGWAVASATRSVPGGLISGRAPAACGCMRSHCECPGCAGRHLAVG
jgi:predicted anti-sigma-YlaC factor YlaD